MRRFGQALVLAASLPPGTRHIYAHFLHTPASVARYAAAIAGLSWSVSAHAKDIWTSPDWEKREKLADAAWAVTCTAVGARHLADLADRPDKVDLVYHGLDFARFPPPPVRSPAPVQTILSVGRAVEKKGYDDLLAALARLPDDLPWRFVHIGGGALKDRLARQSETLGLSSRVRWRGAQPQDAVLAALREADVFVLASKIAEDGDRDGLPNVLMEAQSQAVPVVATAVSAIGELIRDGETGLLVPPGDPDALAAAIARCLGDPIHARALGRAGEERVRAAFDSAAGIARIAAKLSGPPARAATRQAA